MGAEQDTLGLCHICQMVGLIKYCPRCEHWFCRKCRLRFFHRGLEAIKQMIQGKREGCCGPLEDDEDA